MNRLRKTVLVVVLALALTPVSVLAKHGPPPTGEEILAGTPFEVTGEILRIHHRGAVTLSLGDGEVKIFGFAPAHYFEDLEVVPPQSGDIIQVNGYVITQDDREAYIAMSVTIDGDTIVFRDAGTGEELWEHPHPNNEILDGTPFDVTGEVVSTDVRDAMVLATASGDVTIYGTGPDRYWEETGVDFPSVGETVQATGYIVDLNDTQRYIAFTVVIGDDSIQLRDTETGRPLWRGGHGHRHGRRFEPPPRDQSLN